MRVVLLVSVDLGCSSMLQACLEVSRYGLKRAVYLSVTVQANPSLTLHNTPKPSPEY